MNNKFQEFVRVVSGNKDVSRDQIQKGYDKALDQFLKISISSLSEMKEGKVIYGWDLGSGYVDNEFILASKGVVIGKPALMNQLVEEEKIDTIFDTSISFIYLPELDKIEYIFLDSLNITTKYNHHFIFSKESDYKSYKKRNFNTKTSEINFGIDWAKHSETEDYNKKAPEDTSLYSEQRFITSGLNSYLKELNSPKELAKIKARIKKPDAPKPLTKAEKRKANFMS